jgi:hypothetical protein
MPKKAACGWWATIASVDCSGSTAKPPDSDRPIYLGSMPTMLEG